MALFYPNGREMGGQNKKASSFSNPILLCLLIKQCSYNSELLKLNSGF